MLGCCLIDPRLCERAAIDDFYLGMKGLRGYLFMCLDDVRLEVQGEDPTRVFLRRILLQRDRLRTQFGGSMACAILECMKLCPRVDYVEEYMYRCREAKGLRNEFMKVETRLTTVLQKWQRHRDVLGI